jgi:hypothetical protein
VWMVAVSAVLLPSDTLFHCDCEFGGLSWHAMGCELEIAAVTSDTALWAELCVGVTAVSRLVALL